MSNTPNSSMMINILLKKEDDMWVGHCLELDIVATAPTEKQLRNDIIDLITAAIDYAFRNDNLDNLFHPAPAEVWEAFYRCKSQTEERVDLKPKFREGLNGKAFVPPWIMTKTCLAENSCSVR